MLCQLDHRGGQGSDPHTGDGAGIMMQIPDAFFKKVCADFNLPEKGRYGVGMIFFSKDDSGREKSEARINELIEQEGQTVLGWRTAPVNVGKIGTVAQESAPVVRQVFIGANEALKDNLAFERKLYIIRTGDHPAAGFQNKWHITVYDSDINDISHQRRQIKLKHTAQIGRASCRERV